jgi:glucose/arabinose dehydrogenase
VGAWAGGVSIYLSALLPGAPPPLETQEMVLLMSPSQPVAGAATFALTPLVLGFALHFSLGIHSSCDPDNAGLVVPRGSCATLVASGIGAVRQLTVAPNGDLYAAIADGGSGGVLALRDTNGDGKPDERASFGPSGANDVEIRNGYIYVALDDRVLRYRLSPGKLEPQGKEETVIEGLPHDGNHKSKSLAFGSDDALYLTIGSATNSCQEADRRDQSPGKDPCRELEQRAGIWQFSADRLGQRFSDGRRFATGLRNALALTTQPGTGALFAAVHGRDQLSDNWGFSDQMNANNPAEELVRVGQGDDFGWPYCYYSNEEKKKVLAPEYGGDGKKVGRCASAKKALLAFPGHWAPLALAFYNGREFGPGYHGGLFVAFHGSWNRSPLPQEGFRVVFVPFAGGRPSGAYSTFAKSTEGPTTLRASGLAVAPDGTLYISADQNQKIWKVSKGR